MQYTVSYTSPNRRFIDIILCLDAISEEEIFIQLPSWRPGRYELANFAKNIQKLFVLNDKGEELAFNKVTKDRWRIAPSSSSKIFIHYNYYAFQMDAGNSYLDDSQLYINFINCMIYDEKRINNKCIVKIKLPDDFQIACGLDQPHKNVLEAPDFYRLVDSPMIASNNLKHLNYTFENCIFHLWFMGDVTVDGEKIVKDFKAFSETQISTMEGFPHAEYHFLFQILPYKHYHGVEHYNSTVITLGPSEIFHKPEFYNNFLGVSSHELFHTWNVIMIRPQEMMPYDFSRENYFKTGFVAEGFTTYYGDLFLVKSGVYDKKTYLNELNTTIHRHYENQGRFNLSLTDSSFDLWLDGYVAGIPNRKVSIYIKGAVIALMLDLTLRSGSDSRKSLDDVMRHLWQNFGKRRIGYSLEDVKTALESVARKNLNEFFKKFIEGTEPEELILDDLLKFVGCRLVLVNNPGYEEKFGFKSIPFEGKARVSIVEPGSVAENILSVDDEIIAINNRKIENNLADLVENKQEIEITFFRNKLLKKAKLTNRGEKYFRNFSIVQNPNASEQEKENFQNWLGCPW